MTIREKVARAFMDSITWQHHLEADSDGAKLYALSFGSGYSLDECGIVEVGVRLVRWVKPQDLYK